MNKELFEQTIDEISKYYENGKDAVRILTPHADPAALNAADDAIACIEQLRNLAVDAARNARDIPMQVEFVENYPKGGSMGIALGVTIERQKLYDTTVQRCLEVPGMTLQKLVEHVRDHLNPTPN